MGGYDITSTPSSVGDSNWHPCSHKPSSLTFMPPAHAYAFAWSGGALSAWRAVCLWLFCLSGLSWACLWLIEMILCEQEMGILLCLCVCVCLRVCVCVCVWERERERELSRVTMQRMETDGWVIHLKLFTYVAASKFSSVVLFLSTFMSFCCSMKKKLFNNNVSQKDGLELN